MNYFRVGDFVQDGLVVEEVKHVFDGKRQRRLAVRRAEYRLQQVVNKLLYRYLQANTTQRLLVRIKCMRCGQQQEMSP